MYPLVVKTVIRTITHEYHVPPSKTHQSVGNLRSKTGLGGIMTETQHRSQGDYSQPHDQPAEHQEQDDHRADNSATK
jgi:hypothetical protein